MSINFIIYCAVILGKMKITFNSGNNQDNVDFMLTFQ